MKVTIVVPRFPLLSETFIIRQAEGLRANVITFHSTEMAIPAGMQCEVLPDKKSFIDYIRKPFGGTYRLKYAASQWFLKLLGELKPDVLLCNFGGTGLRIASIAKHHLIPMVIHFHGYDLSKSLRDPTYQQSLKSYLQEGGYCVVVNTLQKERLISLGCHADKVKVIPCGVPLEEFEYRGKEPSPECCKFISVGRFVEKKSPLNVINAFAYCYQKEKNITLDMVGDGPLLKEAIDLAKQKGVSDLIHFHGGLVNTEVQRLLSISSVFLQHSVIAPDGDEEGWPVGIAEAAATGLPVISTRHGGIPNQVLHGISGFLVDEHDFTSMGRYMAVLAGDIDKRVQYGKASRDHIVSRGDVRQSIVMLKAFMALAIKP